MPVTFNGLSSGIDTAALMKATLDAQRVPVTALQNKKTSYNAQISGLGKISSKLGELKTLATDMAKTSNVLAFTIGVGDEDVMSAKAEGESSAARYDINVTQLARAEKDRSAAFSSSLSQVKAGTLTLATAGDTSGPYTIDIVEGDELEDVVDKINGSGAKVDASIIRDGTRSYLQIVAAESGFEIGGNPDNAITVTESYTGATGQALGLTQVIGAQNALLEVDGLAAETRSNEPSDIVAGITLGLKKVGTSTLSVASDKDGTKTKLKAFVDKANELLDLVKSSTRTSDGTRAFDPDPAIERLGADVRGLIVKTIDGLSGSNTSLSRIGIETDATGRLTIDDKKLDKALATDMRGVARIFTLADTGLSANVQSLVKRNTNSVDGVIGGRTKSLNKRVDQLDTQIGRIETRIGRNQTIMQRQFTAMEKALQISQSQGSALQSLYSR